MNNDQDLFGQFGAGTSPELAAYPGEGMVLGGRYRLVAEAGEGGMGRVYKALDIDASGVMNVDVQVAIKVLSPALRKDKRANAALKREALGAQRLTHPNIVRMHGYSTDGPWTFLVMEWLAGSTLDDKLVEAEEQGEQGLSFGDIAPHLPTLAEDLDYAHAQGVIHRDIKPGNIFITDQGRVVLVDFGVARQAHASQSRLSGKSASPSGTVEYLPPEAFVGGHNPDARDDVYGLAVTLYELLSGSTPFQGPMVTNRTGKQRPGRPDGLSDPQWEVLLASLDVDRELRPASVGEFALTLLDAPDGEQEWRELEAVERSARQQADESRRRGQRRILEPVDIHGWDAERIQDRQRCQAEELGIPVVFRDQLADGRPGPEMVLIPSGVYLMGSQGDGSHVNDEGPQHRVTIARPFAIGRYALTFAEWDAFADATSGYRSMDEGWGRGARPVINVSWEDAQAYLRWLNSQTRQGYRLPSEAEWEYACRAGTSTRFNTGNLITKDQANFSGNYPAEGCPRGRFLKKTAPVGTYPPNPFGLSEMHGNAWEWVADCWNDRYQGAPSDGSAWMSGNCSRAVLRGGSWSIDRGWLRSASRNWNTRHNRRSSYGFRVARSVTL